MVGFTPDSVPNVEGVEDLECSTLQAVSLAVEYLFEPILAPSSFWKHAKKAYLSTPLVDNARFDTTSTHPVGKHHAGRASSNNENIDMIVGLSVSSRWGGHGSRWFQI